MEITSPRGRSDCCTRRKIHPRTGHAFSCPPTIRLPFSFSFSLSLFLSRLASSRHDRATRLALCIIGDFPAATWEREREKKWRSKNSPIHWEKQGCRDEERQRLNRREKEERERGRERVSSQVFILVHRFPRLATVYGMATCMYAK